MREYFPWKDEDNRYRAEVERRHIRLFDGEECLIDRRVQKVFVGRSPRNAFTRLSRTYGRNYTGISLLVRELDGTNTYIGSQGIFNFRGRVRGFISLVIHGAHLPFAFGESRGGLTRVWLIYSKITTLLTTETVLRCRAPWFVWTLQLIVPLPGNISWVSEFDRIKEFRVNGVADELIYGHDPGGDYDKLRATGLVEVVRHGVKSLSRREYVRLMKWYGRMVGLRRLRTRSLR